MFKITYHICYAVSNLEHSLNTAKKMGAACVVEPVEDIAFDGRKITFVMHPSHGLLELVEAYPRQTLSSPKSNVKSQTEREIFNRENVFANQLNSIFAKLLPSLSDENLFNASLGSPSQWDSLMQLQLIMAIESNFNCHVPSSLIGKLTSYRGIYEWTNSISEEKNSESQKKHRIKEKNDARVLRFTMKSNLSNYAGKPALVHTDIVRTAPFISDTSQNAPLQSHRQLFDSCMVDWWIPAFNYQFPRTHELDLRTASIEAGKLNQFLHDEQWADFRTFDPMFSVLGKGTPPFQPTECVSSFGHGSMFDHLLDKDGVIVLYGATIASLTILHHAESIFGGVPYRYEKLISGKLTDDQGHSHSIEWRSHFRPFGQDLDYDWGKVETVLMNAGVVRQLVSGYPYLGSIIDARGCTDVLVEELKKDPLIFLDSKSRAWVEPKLNQLGRGFLITDFELKE